MGCGKAHPAKAAESVNEPERRDGDKRPSGRDQPAQVAAEPSSASKSGPNTAASTAGKLDPEGAAGLRAAGFCDSTDVSLRPPRPPPPPSQGAVVIAPGRERAEIDVPAQLFTTTADKHTLRAAGKSEGNNPAWDQISANAPLTDTPGLRATAAATSATGRDAAVNSGMPGPPEAPQTPSQETGPLPGTICTTPRQNRKTPAPKPDESKKKVGKAHMSKAFTAFSATEDCDIDSALAMLVAEAEPEDRPSPSAAPKWPLDIFVSPSSRVLVLTWARWARNSLRTKAEIRIKAMQHIKHPKGPRHYMAPRTPPISPQPTPRAGPDSPSADGASRRLKAAGFDMEQSQQAPPSRGGGKQHPAMAPRSRTANGVAGEGRREGEPKGLFDVMAEERREAQDAVAMKKRLQKNFTIEDAHTNSDSTPGFGIETPNPWNALSQTASGCASVLSSGVASPMAGGQMSPWLLEAEALVNGEDDFPTAEFRENIPTSNAWGFAPSKLCGVPEKQPFKLFEEEQIPRSISEEVEQVDCSYEDELDAVGVFTTAGLSESGSPNAPDSEGQRVAPELLGADSMASTATSPAPFTRNRGGSYKDKDSPCSDAMLTGGPSLAFEALSGTGPATGGSAKKDGFAVGANVSYWSASRGVWLPAVVVEKKSSKVYVIDKQMKGCLAKVRASELISADEVQQDPILRALAAFGEPSSSSRAGTPRSQKGTPRGTPCGTPRGQNWQPPGAEASPRGISPRGISPRGSPPKVGSPQKASRAPTIRAELPASLMGVAEPAFRSPSRGKIVRNDFSDDSDDD